MSTPNKNIVIVTSEFPPQPGGIGNHAYNLALYLSKENYEVHVITDQRSENGEDEVVFDEKLPYAVTRIRRYNWRFRMYLKRIEITYKSIKKASHIVATGKFSLWNVAFLNIFFRRKSIAVIHGSEVNFQSYLLKKTIAIALKKMQTIIAVSNYTKSLVNHLNKKVEVIPNGIDLAKWKLEEIPKTSLRGTPSLTTVGRVSTRKGQLNVIKLLPKLIEHFPELHYHCVGIPTEAEDFMKIAKDLKVDSYITFHGSLENNALKKIVYKTDVFVMLSSESNSGDVEGFGIAILEANALGVPAIGSKGCGIEDAIEPSVSGVLVEVNDATQFSKAIETILDSKMHYQIEAKKWAKKHDWSNIIKRYIALIE